jgi:hypothetical protein
MTGVQPNLGDDTTKNATPISKFQGGAHGSKAMINRYNSSKHSKHGSMDLSAVKTFDAHVVINGANESIHYHQHTHNYPNNNTQQAKHQLKHQHTMQLKMG